MRAGWLHVLAIGLLHSNRADEAFVAEREAVGLWRELVRPGNARLVDALETQANIQIKRKQFADAEVLLFDLP